MDYPKWRKTFLEAGNSPACYTRTLTVDGTLGDEGASSWVRGFSRVQQLIVECGWGDPGVTISLSQYRELAPSLKSLHVNAAFFPSTQTFDLIRFLPLLEDLAFRGRSITSKPDRQPTITPSPALTGTLDILVLGGMKNMLRPLLDSPGGLRFRNIKLMCCYALDLTSVTELVEACSDTLECFDVTCEIYGVSGAVPLPDLLFTHTYSGRGPRWLYQPLQSNETQRCRVPLQIADS